ncbi:MAG: KEOPS complex kinase/ATPase Bud32 [Nanoarchaeota archaeon]|nr:KEOPS complex kinase/ATPase Bud32 [Nanoarchaeota archaeon]
MKLSNVNEKGLEKAKPFQRQIAQGAEAKLFLKDNKIIKDRFKKEYRIKEIDQKLRKSRTKREAKIFDKLTTINFPAPKLIKSDDKERIEMELVDGKKVRDILEKSDYKKLSEEIGKKIAILHNNNIIHGDLTTSNMMMSKEIYFIDFGLSFFSHKIEDKAVDLHLLKQALESKHYTICEDCFKEAIKSYKKECKEAKEVLIRLETVEDRGRYKGKRDTTKK